MSVLPNRSTMSVEEYFELDRNSEDVRYEYIDGHIYMMAGGSANHSRISANIIGLLYNQLHGGSCDIHTTDMKVQLSERRYVYPDVSVSCDDRDRGNDDRLRHPCLIIEVLSPSTEVRDRGIKLSYYRACPSIQECVLVDSQRQFVEVYRRKGNFWVIYSYGPSEQVELTSLNVSFSMDALYERTVLPPEEDE